MEILITEYTRTWKYPEESSYTGISFSLKNKPTDRIFIVKDDYYPKMWDIHFMYENLDEKEKKFILSNIIQYIPTGSYIGTCGEYDDNKIKDYSLINLKETIYLRVLKNKQDPSITLTFNILKKDGFKNKTKKGWSL